MRAPLLLVLLLPLLAGCTGAPESTRGGDDGPNDSAPDDGGPAPTGGDAGARGASCEERFAGPRGENALLISALQDPPDVLAARVAEAMGDALQGEPTVEEHALTWRTDLGALRYERVGEQDVRVAWSPEDAAAIDAEEDLAVLLDAVYAPPFRAREGSAILQTWEDEPIHGTGARAEGGHVTLLPVYQFEHPLEAHAELDARAGEALACLGAQASPTRGELAVREGSLVRAYRADGRCALLDVETASLAAVC